MCHPKIFNLCYLSFTLVAIVGTEHEHENVRSLQADDDDDNSGLTLAVARAAFKQPMMTTTDAVLSSTKATRSSVNCCCAATRRRARSCCCTTSPEELFPWVSESSPTPPSRFRSKIPCTKPTSCESIVVILSSASRRTRSGWGPVALRRSAKESTNSPTLVEHQSWPTRVGWVASGVWRKVVLTART